MLVQYLQYKERYPDCLLLFQVGDFYELFFEDAVTVSRVLNLTLTSRDKNNPDPVPMAGVPIAVVDGYVSRLVAAGYSAAIVSQSEAPAGKGAIERRLERIVTPGIQILGDAENAESESIVAAVHVESEQDLALAFADVKTGKIFVRDGLGLRMLRTEIGLVAPSEVVAPRSVAGQAVDRRTGWVRELESALGGRIPKFRPEAAAESGSRRGLGSIPGYAPLGASARKAVRLLVEYIDETAVSGTVPIDEILEKRYDDSVWIDATSRANLELVRNLRDGSVRGTLLETLDLTHTPGGGRMLRQWIVSPLRSAAAILARQQAAETLRSEVESRAAIRKELALIPDLERVAVRTELGIVSPRELGALRDALAAVPRIRALLEKDGLARASALIGELAKSLSVPAKASAALTRTLVDVPPLASREGGIIREGVDAELDRLRGIKQTGRSWIAELEADERKRSGINSLKIRFNNVLGFFIEITQANVNKVPANYIRRQSTVNAERFTTVELKEREAEVMGAETRQVELERALFEALRKEILPEVPAFRRLAETLSALDVLSSFAEVADREGYIRPEVDESRELFIEKGKHPVLARSLQGRFVPNTLEMPEAGPFCYLLTGPNMGGKSTYLRQAALLVVMTQIGSFIPAARARVGVVDRIFARLGASDNLLEGESTFMVEMREASHILARAGERSLLVIDEIGRGTATLDGLAVAQAILEWIVTEIRARTLFATHYHELTGLADSLEGLGNLSVGSIDRGEDVVFTHEICSGAASKSYGLEVAKLAGLPQHLLERARELLTQNEQTHAATPKKSTKKAALRAVPQLSLFERPRTAPPADYAAVKAAAEQLKTADVDNLTPMQALGLISKLRAELKNGG